MLLPNYRPQDNLNLENPFPIGAITLLIGGHVSLKTETWSFMLNSHSLFRIIADCENDTEVPELAQKLRPHVILLEMNPPEWDGRAVSQQILQDWPEAKILAFSNQSQLAHSLQMLTNGTLGYVMKNCARQEMFNAILKVVRGYRYVCEEMKQYILSRTGALISLDGMA